MPIIVEWRKEWAFTAYVAPTNGLRMYPWRVAQIGPLRLQVRPRLI